MEKNNETNTEPTFKVMLAKPIASEIDWLNAHFVQPKLDGVRCYITKDGAFSRNHKPFYNVKHILTELKPFFNDNPHITLDGELYNHKYRDNFNKIISLVRKQKPTQADRFEAASSLQFHCYDLFDSKQPKLSFIDRTLAITGYQSLYKWRSIQPVDTKVVFNDNDVQKFHKQNKANKYEGSMLRNNNPYDQRRSNNLQKVKDWSDTEFEITGFVEGKGKFERGLGKFIGFDSDGREVEVPWPTLTLDERRKMWSQRVRYIGKVLTFEYFERTPAGAYRFPRAKAFRNYE
jgi:DNA ligase-1